MIPTLINHLWQSTLVALACALVAMALRRHRAGLRFGVWMAASLKFLLPFAALTALGEKFRGTAPAEGFALHLAPMLAPTLTPVRVAFAPFHGSAPASASISPVSWLLLAWALGALTVVGWRLRDWRKLRRMVRTARPADPVAGIEVRATSVAVEPSVVGWLRPVLLLPAGMSGRLSPKEFESVIAHERSHIHRRDNLWSRLHMTVEAAFWFHPAVWWIGARLVDERERACDEAVLAAGAAPGVYAEAIVRVCRMCVEAPALAACVAGGNLRARLEVILAAQPVHRLHPTGRSLLAMAAGLVLVLPVLAGVSPVSPSRWVRLVSAPPPMMVPAELTAPGHVFLPAAPTFRGARGAAALGPAPTSIAAPASMPLAWQTTAPPEPMQALPALQGRNLIVLYFDLKAMQPQDLPVAVAQSQEFLDKKMQPIDMVAIAALQDRLQVAQDFTADKDQLRRVLSALPALPSGANAFSVDGVPGSLAGLQAVCEMLAPIPQKKSIIDFNGPIARDPQNTEAALHSAVAACSKAGAAIYPVALSGGLPSLAASSPASSPAQSEVGVTTKVTGAVCTQCPLPFYPVFARKAHITGAVTLAVQIAADGTVAKVDVVGDANQLFANAAKSTVSAWRFEPPKPPGITSGNVLAAATVTITFSLGQ